MDFEISLYGTVDENGKLIIPRKKLSKELEYFKGKSIELIIRKKKKHRSHQQNKFYWILMTIIAEHTGFTKEESHEIMKEMFLKVDKVNEKTGVIYKYTRHTPDLTTSEFMDYLSDIYKWASTELELRLPEVNEQLEMI